MNVLMLARSLPAHGAGGMESAAWDLARALGRAGARVTLLTTAHPDLADDAVVEGVRLRTIAAPPGRYSRAWWRGSTALFDAELAETTDVVLGVSAAANALAARRRPGEGPPLIFQAHGTSWGVIGSKLSSASPRAWMGAGRSLAWGLFKDPIYRRYDAVAAVGSAVRDQLQSPPTAWLRGRTPVAFLPNGVDEAAFAFDPQARAATRAGLGYTPDERVILSLSRLHPQKGVDVGLAAFAQAARSAPDLRLLIAGDGPARPALEATAGRSGLAGRVRFLGAVRREEAPALLAAADALLFPTRRGEAGATLSVLEALASGLPVIVSVHGAEATMPVTRLPDGDVDAFAAAILRVAPGAEKASLLPADRSLTHVAGRYLQLFDALKRGGRS